MRDISKEDLKEIISRHHEWLMDIDKGERANLSFADLRSADLSSADLSSANLRSADLSFADLSFADLSSADLSSADLSFADLSFADLSSADLRSADLSSADLSSADLSSADLSFADLSFADLSSADLRSADHNQDTIYWDTVGNSSEIKTLCISDDYIITYTSEYLQIGCERHDIKDWWKFDDEKIKAMDGVRALEFWSTYKSLIKKTIKVSPAKPFKGE